MYSTQIVWLIALFAALAGAAGGYILSRTLRRESRSGQTEEALRKLQEEQKAYRHRVTQHFGQTAELLSQLAGNYRDVHNHLAQGARELCDAEASARLRPIDERVGAIEAPATGVIEPPRDYALRNENKGGTLDEDFGLEKANRTPLPEPPRF